MLGSLLSPWAPFSMQKKKNGRFLFLRPSRIAWQTLLVTKLRLVYNKTDLLSQLGEQISFVSRFLAVLLGSSKPFRSNFGMTHVWRKRSGQKYRAVSESLVLVQRKNSAVLI